MYCDVGRRNRLAPADVGKNGYLVFLLELLIRRGDASIDRYENGLTVKRQFRKPLLYVIDDLTDMASIGKKNLQFLLTRHLSLDPMKTYGNHHHLTLSSINTIDFTRALRGLKGHFSELKSIGQKSFPPIHPVF